MLDTTKRSAALAGLLSLAVGCAPAPQESADFAAQLEACEAALDEYKIMTDHTNPPIILGKGNSLVWRKRKYVGTDKLPANEARKIFNGNNCSADLKLLNFAMIGKGVDAFDARTTDGEQIRDATYPLSFSGIQGGVSYRLDLFFDRRETRYVFHRNDVACTLQAIDQDHTSQQSQGVPWEFKFLGDQVTWNGKDVDVDHGVEFTTYER